MSKKFQSRKWFNLAVAAVFTGILIAGRVQAASYDNLDPLYLTIGHNNTGVTVTTFIADEFKRILEEKTGGKISVTIYPAAQMGNDREMLDAVRDGSLGFVVQNTGSQVSNVPNAAVFDMPFLFNNAEEGRKAVDDPTFRALLNKSYHDSDLDLLLMSDQGFRELSNNRKIDSYDALKGMNLRVMENQVHIAFWRAMGVNAIPMNQTEVFLSLQQGLIDGQENPYITIDNFKLQEVQKYLIDTHHIFHLVTVVGNKDFMDNLPEAYQRVIRETMDEILVSSREMSTQSTEEYRQKLIKDGMIFIGVDTIPGMREKMREATKDTVNLIRQTVDSDLVDAYLKASGR